MNTWRILVGDVRERLSELPAGSVQTCVTSPPYFGLRDYGTEGQIGLEPTPAAYVSQLVEVFAGVWRVLRDDGTVWLNLGDSYAAGGHGGGGSFMDMRGGDGDPAAGAWAHRKDAKGWRKPPAGLKPKDLIGIPWLVAFALRDAGWYLRSDIIWAKPNPMPESVTDRPTKSHEYLFLLSKSERYYYDAAAIREENSESSLRDFESRGQIRKSFGNGETACGFGGAARVGQIGNGRNKRTVWTVATQPYPESHFATFPEDLITPCILAGTSEKGQCPACGAPWARVVEREFQPTQDPRNTKCGNKGLDASNGWGETPRGRTNTATLGWQPSCACNAGDPVPQLVLDPFTGSGTTGAVAIRHQRSFVGCELNPAYVELARQRIGGVAPMFAEEVA